MIAEPIPWPRRWSLVLRGKVLAAGTYGKALAKLYQLPAEKRAKAELRVAGGKP